MTENVLKPDKSDPAWVLAGIEPDFRNRLQKDPEFN